MMILLAALALLTACDPGSHKPDSGTPGADDTGPTTGGEDDTGSTTGDDSGGAETGETGETGDGTPDPIPSSGAWARVDGLSSGSCQTYGSAGSSDYLLCYATGDHAKQLVRLDDGALPWVELPLSATVSGLTGVDALRGDDDAVYWATPDTGIYVSDDRGATWAAMDLPWEDGTVYTTPGTGTIASISQTFWHDGGLYVVRDVSYREAYTDAGHAYELRIYRDGAWTTADLPDKYFRVSAGESRLYGVVYAPTQFCTSDDDGESWDCASSTIPTYATVYERADGSLLAVGSSAIARSTDDGASWTALSSATSILYQCIDEGVVYALDGYGSSARLLSVDGSTVSTVSQPDLGGLSYKTIAVVADEVTLGTSAGVWALQDDGSWADRSPYGTKVLSLATDGDAIWAADEDDRLYVTGSSGEEWSQLALDDIGWGSAGSWDTASLRAPTWFGDSLYAGGSHGRVWSSDDPLGSTDTWDYADVEPYGYDPQALAVSGDALFIGFDGGVVSDDDGASIGVVGGGVERYSAAGGWEDVSGELPVRVTTRGGVTTTGPAIVASLYADDAVLIAATDQGLAVSDDEGDRWSLPLPIWDATTSRTRAARAGGRLLLAVQGDTGLLLYGSDDDGVTWEALSGDLDGSVALGDLDALDDAFVLGDRGGDVYRSADGVHWAPLALTPLTVGVEDLAVSGDQLYAGTPDGVWIWSD